MIGGFKVQFYVDGCLIKTLSKNIVAIAAMAPKK